MLLSPRRHPALSSALAVCGAFALLFAGAWLQRLRSADILQAPRAMSMAPPAAAPPSVSASPAAAAADIGDESEPPAWLSAGHCAPPGASRAAAKPPLFGACACPLRNAPANWTSFDCGVFDGRIRAALAPWADAGANLSHAALDATWALTTANIPPAYHISVHGGKVYYKRQGPASAYDEKLLDMLRTVAARVPLPDVEFVLHPWDHQKVPRQDPAPVFGFTSGPASNDILFPYPYAWRAGGFDLGAAACGADRARLADRPHARVFWRGRCSGTGAAGFVPELAPFYLRYRAAALGAAHADVLDVGLVEDCVDAGGGRAPPLPPRAPLVELEAPAALCEYRHLLMLDGNTASGRSSVWVHAGAALVWPTSVWREWYYDALQPWRDFAPARERLGNLPERARWLAAHPRAAQCLADNLAAAAKRYVNADGVACYVWRLLSAYARVQSGGSRLQGFSPA